MKKIKWMILMVAITLFAAGCGKEVGDTGEQTEEVSNVQTEVTADEEAQTVLPEVSSTDDWDSDVVYAPADLTCVIPQGFVDNGENQGLYIHKSYPKDISTINHVISEGEEDISTWSAENFKEQLEQDYYDSYGDEVNIQIVQNDKIKVDGRPGLRLLLEFEFKGVSYEQLMYVFYNGTETHYVYFTQEKGNKWMDAFVESGESIHFVDQQ